MFRQTDTMGDYRTSMVLDYVNGRPLEVEAILGAPVRRAAELGVDAPSMSTLYSLVHAADLRNRGLMPSITRPD
jgi:2-dehydropantoate 2-reductase